MIKFENIVSIEKLESAKHNLVPYIFSENYFCILKKKLEKKTLSANEAFYYSHFINKKLQGMADLFGISDLVNGSEFIRKDRLIKAKTLLKKYSRKHKNKKILITGSFLWSKKYNDIDVFVISRYEKEDYHDKNVHINFLPDDIETKLFFKSIYGISVANFKSEGQISERLRVDDILMLYELVILFILQKDNYLQELRDLILKLEYVSSGVVINSMQLKIFTEKILRSKKPIEIINKYLASRIMTAYGSKALKKTLNNFIKKNSIPEKGKKIYDNWIIYNTTYKEALEVVA